MTDEEIRKLCKTAENDPDNEKANAAMRELEKINITYHWCWDWDGMVICDTDREFSCCTCFKD